jgi:hypothetical protein
MASLGRIPAAIFISIGVLWRPSGQEDENTIHSKPEI